MRVRGTSPRLNPASSGSVDRRPDGRSQIVAGDRSVRCQPSLGTGLTWDRAGAEGEAGEQSSMATIVFGSPEARTIRRRIAALERLEALPMRTYYVSGEVTYAFEVTVEARTCDEAKAKIEDMYPYDLGGVIDDLDIREIHEDGLANPDDPEEQARERARLQRGANAVPAQRLV